MMVTLVGLLAAYHGLALTTYEMAELAYKLERERLGIQGGLQDHYAATFGGFNFIEFSGEGTVVNPLRIASDTVLELEHNLLLCYTGNTRQSDRIIEDQTARFEEHESATIDGLRQQKELAVSMKDALLRGDLRSFGELLGEAWEAKKRMSPRISTERIDEMYAEARRHGALGGKVTGAGGGGFMLLYCDYRRKHEIAAVLERMGGRVDEFAFAIEGLRTWRFSG
jgi:D-glycero-alpha-D-manno-heptose-7-phosphate kinase